MTKTKKNLRPQQVAPVQRESTATNFSAGGKGVDPQYHSDRFMKNAFAGDDAE